MALEIDKRLHGIPVTSYESGITTAENKTDFKIGSSNRIGVRKDLKKKLRFYIEGNVRLKVDNLHTLKPAKR